MASRLVLLEAPEEANKLILGFIADLPQILDLVYLLDHFLCTTSSRPP